MIKELLPGLPWTFQRNGRFITASLPGGRTYELIQIFPGYCGLSGTEKESLRYNVGKLCVAAPKLYSEINHLITKHEKEGECLPSDVYVRLKRLLEDVDLSDIPHVGKEPA